MATAACWITRWSFGPATCPTAICTAIRRCRTCSSAAPENSTREAVISSAREPQQIFCCRRCTCSELNRRASATAPDRYRWREDYIGGTQRYQPQRHKDSKALCLCVFVVGVFVFLCDEFRGA